MVLTPSQLHCDVEVHSKPRCAQGVTLRLEEISLAVWKDVGVWLTSKPPLGLTTYLPPYCPSHVRKSEGRWNSTRRYSIVTPFDQLDSPPR